MLVYTVLVTEVNFNFQLPPEVLNGIQFSLNHKWNKICISSILSGPNKNTSGVSHFLMWNNYVNLIMLLLELDGW